MHSFFLAYPPCQLISTCAFFTAAYGLNNSARCTQSSQLPGCRYEDDLFAERVNETIYRHDATKKPLFLVFAPHNLHLPFAGKTKLCASSTELTVCVTVPQIYLDTFSFIDNADRKFYSAMVSHLDDMVGNVTAAIVAKGLWESSLIIVTSDNGGDATSGGASNYPLRGEKLFNWEGGVRVNSFASGGFIAPSLRGTIQQGLVATADLYTTFASLAGVDSTDRRAARAGLPPVDGLDVSGLFTGMNTVSPRIEVSLGGLDDTGRAVVQGLIRADGFKLLTGPMGGGNYQGPLFPNGSAFDPAPIVDCGPFPGYTVVGKTGCLFNIFTDPSEQYDLEIQFPDVVAEMRERLEELQSSVYDPSRGEFDPNSCNAALGSYGGYWGPWVS